MDKEEALKKVIFILINNLDNSIDHPISLDDDNKVWYKMRNGDSDTTGEPYYILHPIEPQHALDILNATIGRKK